MKLLLDVGNTRIKWALEVAGELTASGSAAHRGKSFAEALAFLEELDNPPDSAWVLNVAGAEFEIALAEAVQARFGLPLERVRTAASACGVTNGYTAAEQLGADRWAAVVAGWNLYGRPVCVADVGTAVTIDLVAEGGAHQGGIILPGLRLMMAALQQDTSDIADFVKDSRGDVPAGDWFGRDTLTAVQRGAVFALRSSIAAAAGSLGEGSEHPLVVLTGGDAELLGEIPGCEVVQEPLLVLKGLALLSAGGQA